MSKRNIIRIASVATLLLALSIAVQFTDELQWNEAIAYGVILLLAIGTYKLWQWLKTQNKMYRYAFGVGIFGMLFLGWANGAVGIIGSENNPANLMYWAVFAIGLIGSLLSRFKPRGMARTLFATAVVQMLVPVFALSVWPAKASWGDAGVIGVFILNFIFATLFVMSALLFQRADTKSSK